MSYKCLSCGHIFDDGEQRKFCERHGFDDGRYESFDGCPICCGDYEETVECAICGSQHTPEELIGGMCEDCIENSKNDFEGWLKVSQERTSKVEILDIIATLLEPAEIEHILIEYIREKHPDIDCSKFIFEEPETLCEYYLKEVIEI